MKENKPILVSVSGGRTSAFMAVFLKERFKDREMLCVFANTGKEREETLIFLDRLDKQFNLNLVWLEAKVNPEKGKGTTFKVVDFESASRNGEPFEEVIKKYGLPSKLYRHCTRELKEAPIHKYTKKILGKDYLTAIGIRADEKHRLTNKEDFIYPLADINVDKHFINNWWSKQPFDLELREHEGNCDFCFLKSQKKRVKLLSEGLDVSWWSRMESDYGSGIQEIFDVRNNLSIEDLIKINNQLNLQTSLLDDVSFDCYCKAS
jgi:hypothetical protein